MAIHVPVRLHGSDNLRVYLGDKFINTGHLGHQDSDVPSVTLCPVRYHKMQCLEIEFLS